MVLRIDESMVTSIPPAACGPTPQTLSEIAQKESSPVRPPPDPPMNKPSTYPPPKVLTNPERQKPNMACKNQATRTPFLKSFMQS
jgi:hypothetical protein